MMIASMKQVESFRLDWNLLEAREHTAYNTSNEHYLQWSRYNRVAVFHTKLQNTAKGQALALEMPRLKYPIFSSFVHSELLFMGFKMQFP